VFLTWRDWRQVHLEDIGEFVAWLRLPPAGRDGVVAVLPSVESQVGASTINRKLAALAAFYQHHVRLGVDVGELLTRWQLPGRRGGWKPFLHHVSKDKPQPRRTIALKAPKKLPRVLTVDEVQTILDACTRLRDRLLLAVLSTAALGSAKRSGSAMTTLPWPSVRSPSCHGSTTTGLAPSHGRSGQSRSASI
jgi:integrase